MNKKQRLKQMWASEEFIKSLERMKAKRLLNGNPVKSIAQLTQEILSSESFSKLEEEISKIDGKEMNIRIKMDGFFR